MSDIEDLMKRIDSEICAADQQVKKFQADAEREYQEQSKRYQIFVKLLEEVRLLTKPRLEALSKRFDFKAIPVEDPNGRGAEMIFDTDLAHVKMEFRASHDHEIRKLILDYHLSIIPVFVPFDPHSQFETPIENPDMAGMTKWFDDRLVDFAKLFLSIQFVQSYQQDHMVSDPIANIRFPKSFAKSTLERDGKTYYFISDKTRSDFEKSK